MRVYSYYEAYDPWNHLLNIKASIINSFVVDERTRIIYLFGDNSLKIARRKQGKIHLLPSG